MEIHPKKKKKKASVVKSCNLCFWSAECTIRILDDAIYSLVCFSQFQSYGDNVSIWFCSYYIVTSLLIFNAGDRGLESNIAFVSWVVLVC